MKRPQSIQINIPNPCSQSWDKMTPSGNGRHCAHCSTTVIDFTTWTDAELYKFFAKGNEHVCGRYLSTQLNRPIHIPPQPHSRLYRMVVAMGLTLVFADPVATQAQVRSQLAKGTLKGHIVVVDKEPADKYLVVVKRDTLTLEKVYADKQGNFEIPSIDTGNYTVSVINDAFDMRTHANAHISPGETTTLSLMPVEIYTGMVAPINSDEFLEERDSTGHVPAHKQEKKKDK